MAYKDKIVANLKAKHPKVQQSVIEFIADKLDPKVTTEADVDTVVTAFEEGPITIADIALQITKEGDKRVTQALNKKPAPGEEKVEKKLEKIEAPVVVNDDPLAKILDAVAGIGSRLDNLEKGKTKETATAKLHAKAKEAKIPLHLVPAIENEEGIDAAIAQATTAYEEIKQGLANEGFAQGKPPAGGGGGQVKTGDTKVIDADISSFVNKELASKGITPAKTA